MPAPTVTTPGSKNVTLMNWLPEGRVLVTVILADGTTDTIEAYDFDAALAFSHMHLAGQAARNRTRPYYA